MGTKGRVRKTNVSVDNIRDISDLDRSISVTNVTGDDIFTNNDLNGNYIDPQYCEGETPEERLAILTSKEYAFGEFRNYGGEDEIIDPGLPEIYFQSVIGNGFNDGNPVELMPQTPETMAYLDDNNLIIGIAVAPNMQTADQYMSASITESKQLVNLVQSAMFRSGADDALNDSNIGVRVGLDYTAPAIEDPKFSYNVSVSYGEIPVEFTIKNPSDNLLKKVAGLFIPKFKDASQSISAIEADASLISLFDYLIGSNSALSVKAKAAIENIGSHLGSTLLGAALQAVGGYISMILVADAIWNFFQSPTNAPEGIFQYKNLVDGVYTFQDVSKSKYQIGFGDLFTGNTNFVSKFISQSTDKNIYAAPVNQPLYPVGSVVGGSLRNQYANFKFFPKCSQYDLMTPPPIITYKIELEPISGCRLSETKPTAFIITICPDKYVTPVFDVITPTGRSSVSRQDVFINTPITFQNAKYSDFIALSDLEPTGGLGGLFKTYENRYINSDGDDMAEFNRYLPFGGDNLVTTGGLAFGGVSYPAGNPRFNLYPAESTYDVEFLQEAQGNLIKNPTFRLERQSEDPNDATNLMSKFWTYDTTWEIRDGAIYRDTPSNLVTGISQSLPAIIDELNDNRGKYYFFEIECTINGGYLDLNLIDTFRTEGICNWLSPLSYYWVNGGQRNRKFCLTGGYAPLYIPDYPQGMSLSSGRLRITSSGRYKVMLRASAPTKKIFNIIPSETFTGRINYVSLQHIPLASIKDSSRACVNVAPQLRVKWKDAVLTSKTITLNFDITEPTTIEFSFKPIEAEYSEYTVTIDWGNGEPPELVENLSYLEYTLSKSYIFPGIKTVTITNSITPSPLLIGLFESFTCNESSLIKYNDASGLLYGGSVDLSDSYVGIQSAYPQLYYMGTESLKTPLYSLNLSNTPIDGGADKLPNISQYLNISNTKIYGNVIDLYDIPSIDISDCRITECSPLGQPSGDDGNKTIIWKNQNIPVQSLYDLLRAIDLSSIEEGYLDIKGNNPPIVDQEALDRITMLTTALGQPDGLGGTGRGWTILYNSLESTFNKTMATLVYNEALDQYELTVGYELYINNYDPTSVLHFDVYDESGVFLETVSRSFTSETPNIWIIPVDDLEDVYIFTATLYTLTVNNGTITT